MFYICVFHDEIGEYEKFNLHAFNEENIFLGKPIHVGRCVLDLSKLKMYEWYDDKRPP